MTIEVSNSVRFDGVGRVTARSIDVGFFETAVYEDGTPVAGVAAVNEFGSSDGRVPERPAFRQAVNRLEDELGVVLGRAVAASGFNIDDAVVERVGLAAQAAVQESITDLRQPPNAPSTVARKGSSNPLVDEGVLRSSVSFEVNR